MTETDWIDYLYLFAVTGGPIILAGAAAYAIMRRRRRAARSLPTESHPRR